MRWLTTLPCAGHLKKIYLGGAVLDVWEGEPEADRKLIGLADLATPHIAGYSVDGKSNATVTVCQAGLGSAEHSPERLEA